MILLLPSDSIGAGKLIEKRQEFLDERFDSERKKSQRERFYLKKSGCVEAGSSRLMTLVVHWLRIF